MTRQSLKIDQINMDISIIQMGYLSDLKDINSYENNENIFLLIISKSDATSLNIEGSEEAFSKNEMIILSLNYAIKISLNRGDGLFIILSGRLASRYIKADRINQIIGFDSNDRIYQSIGKIENMLNAGEEIDAIESSILGFSLLVDLWIYEDKKSSISKIVVDAVEIIEEEYGQLYGVDDLADRIGVNKSYLIRLFNEHLSITPGRYLERYRIEKAKSLLKSGEFSMEMVAKLCGYDCGNYFSKVFKKNTSISPSEFIKTNTAHEGIEIPPEFYL